MRTIVLVCPGCHELVDVVDKTIAQHGTCELSGMHYLPSPRMISGGQPGGPRVEIVASKSMGSRHCDRCHEDHHVVGALLKVTAPNPSNN